MRASMEGHVEVARVLLEAAGLLLGNFNFFALNGSPAGR